MSSKFFCEDCDETFQVESAVKTTMCKVCGAVLEPIKSPNAATENTVVNEISLSDNGMLHGSWDGLFDIIGSDLRDAIEESMSNSSSNRQISVSYLKTLGKVNVDERKTILYDVSLTVGPLTVLAVSASFGWLPSFDSKTNAFEKTTNLVIGNPEHGEASLVNAEACAGSAVLLKRGVVTFTAKAQKAEEAGAAVLIVAQSYDIWPFVMTDDGASSPAISSDQIVSTINGNGKKSSSSSSSSCGDNEGLTISVSNIPVVMISKADAELICKLISSTVANNTSQHSANGNVNSATKPTTLSATLRIGEPVSECSICQEEFAAHDEVLKLSCRHVYHAHCVTEWLHSHNTCPLCRLQLPHRQVGEAPSRRPAGANSVTASYYN